MARASQEVPSREGPGCSLRDRLRALGWRCDAAVADRLSRPLMAMVSSRLGCDPELHRRVGHSLGHSMMECRDRQGTAVVAEGSAIAPWALRAAELFGVATLWLCTDRPKPRSRRLPAQVIPVRVPASLPPRTGSPPVSRDQLVIDAADRVTAMFVRRGGRIEGCLTERIRRCDDASTRVAVTPAKHCAARSLIALGAVGWYVPDHPPLATELPGLAAPAASTSPPPSGPANRCQKPANLGLNTEKQHDPWLIHCTRGCPGPWPGQTYRQHLDAMLLGASAVARRGPLQSLQRIVRCGRLVASAKATAKEFPVVCFSSLPLADLLARTRYRPHLQRWDYQPYGIAIRCEAAAERGIRPVIYGDPADRCQLPEKDRYRFQARGKTYDWTQEREWRAEGDVDRTQFADADVQVFVPSPDEAQSLKDISPWKVLVVGPPD